MNEIHILRHLQHPNIVRLHEVYEADDFIYLVFELLKGQDLQKRVNRKGSFREHEAAEIMKKLLEVLCYCQENKVIHRDIKPGNIISRYGYSYTHRT